MKQKRSTKQVQQSPWTPAPLTVVTPVSPSLRDAAYDAIKHRIITCVFKPGDYLNEAFVSATIGIGRTPVQRNTFYEPIRILENASSASEAEPASGKSNVLEDNLATA